MLQGYYVAEAGEKKFVVINGEEDEGGTHLTVYPVFGQTGNAVAYCNVQSWQALHLHHNEKIVKARQISQFTLSPNGMRHAYYNALSALSGQLIVDGEVKGGGSAYTDPILFSPDSKHFVAMSSAPPKGTRAICLDGSFVPIPKGLDQYTKPLGFTSDSQHLLMRGQEKAKDGNYSMDKYFLDGQLVAQFSAGGIFSGVMYGSSQMSMQSEFYEMQSDGSILIIGHENRQGGFGGVVKRVKITPDASTSLAAWIASTQEETTVVPANQRTRENRFPDSSKTQQETSLVNPVSNSQSQSAARLANNRDEPKVQLSQHAGENRTPSVPKTSPQTSRATFKPLTWADLINRPERWPPAVKLTKQLSFDGDVLAAGTAVQVNQVTAQDVRLIAPQGFGFRVGPADSDLLAAANAVWATLTPEQQALTSSAIQRDSSLWPGRVKVTNPLSFGSMQIAAGTEWPIVEVKGNDVSVIHPQVAGTLALPAQNTDLFFRARVLAGLPPEQRPGYMADLLAGVPVNTEGKKTDLPAARYYVIYFAGSTCPRCKIFTPKFLEYFNKSLAGRKDVALVSWSNDHTTQPMLDYARQNAIPWPTIPVEKNNVINKQAMIVARGGTINLPAILVLDRFGTPLLSTSKFSSLPLDAANAAMLQLDTVLKPDNSPFTQTPVSYETQQVETPPLVVQPDNPSVSSVATNAPVNTEGTNVLNKVKNAADATKSAADSLRRLFKK